MKQWKDLAGSNLEASVGTYISIDDGLHGEYATLEDRDDIQQVTKDYLTAYDFAGSEDPVSISIVVYRDGNEDEFYSCTLTPEHELNGWKLVP